ncbi:HlyD family secretion protein [Labrenzia sp. EL_195]|nr:HlyD family secretion protein [Labrenzia sp. EL_195]
MLRQFLSGIQSTLGNGESNADSIRNHLRVAGAVIFLLVVVGGGWTVLTKISGAVIANGTIVVESEVKQIQHREGGIVKEIIVREGIEVDAGDLLIRLDDTTTGTSYSIISNQLAELRARQARLLAERSGDTTIGYPERQENLLAEEYAELELTQSLLLNARQGSLEKRREQSKDQVEQLENQIDGLEVRSDTKMEELKLLDDELSGVVQLFEKKLVTKNRITELKRDKTRIQGEQSELLSQVASLRETISERQMHMLQIEEDYREEILQELQDVTLNISELELQQVTVQDELSRLEIRAPQAGFVHQLVTHTVGGVIPPGATVLQLVPRDDTLVVDAQVAPIDIDQVQVGQQAQIRFPGLDHRTTPKLAARIQTVAADQSFNEVSRQSFYRIRLQISKDELQKLAVQELVPGMPVEVFVTTEERTVLSYLTKPIVDQIAHAMRES